MLEQARERAPLPAQAAKVVGAPSRFARDPQEFQTEPALGLEAGTAGAVRRSGPARPRQRRELRARTAKLDLSMRLETFTSDRTASWHQ